jgi:hypothetical protein
MKDLLVRYFGLHSDQANSLLLAICIIAVIVVPQWLWSSEVDPETLAKATARRKQRDQLLASKIKHAVHQGAKALGHKPRKLD